MCLRTVVMLVVLTHFSVAPTSSFKSFHRFQFFQFHNLLFLLGAMTQT